VTTIYKPSQVLRLTGAGKLRDDWKPGELKIVCEAKRHPIGGNTEMATWENGSYCICSLCGDRWALVRIIGPDFEVDLRGERKKYPLFTKSRH
jgi:hypothetical protein